MKLIIVVNKYIKYRKSLGEKFTTNERQLIAFSNAIGENIDLSKVSEEKVKKFIFGDGPLTFYLFRKHSTILGFYQYAIARGYVNTLPLPTTLPKKPPSFIPYIYSRDELKNLFKAALTYQKIHSSTVPYVIYVLLVLLYGTGMRLNEALSLTMADIDLSKEIIIVRDAKFYKNRLVPFGKDLAKVITTYIDWRNNNGGEQNNNSSFFINTKGKILNIHTVKGAFPRLRKAAGIYRTDKSKFQPRMHDLRHTFAVHRLVSWYQEHADLQKLLPILSVYLGHSHLSATSVYLTMTDDLLREAGVCFEKYATGGLK